MSSGKWGTAGEVTAVPTDSLHTLSQEELRCIAEELRLHSDQDGGEEYGRYADGTIPVEELVASLRETTPSTTTHLTTVVIKPETLQAGRAALHILDQ